MDCVEIIPQMTKYRTQGENYAKNEFQFLKTFIIQAQANYSDIEVKVLRKILDEKYIKPVYQPIVSLVDGQIFGYEALSRITDEKLGLNIQQIFDIADKTKKTWEIEALCREKTLQNATVMDPGKKLFLNVDPNVIHDEKFRNGFTMECLKKYMLSPSNLIFEITERVAVTDNDVFLKTIDHYKNQNFSIAIDDVGAGFSGLNVIANVKPNYIKIDMNLIRNIDKDEIKQLLCKAMVDFGMNSGIKLIAEGIETEEELKTLIRLKVDYGQGYYLGIPQETFEDISPEKVETITKNHSKNYNDNIKNSIYPVIGYLSKVGYTFSPNESIELIYEKLKHDHAITEFTIVENDIALGFMTKTALNELLGGRYGFSLHSKKTVRQVMNTNFLRANYNMPIDQVSRFAMQRAIDVLYNPIVVEKENKYCGIVTIKDLLDTYARIEIDTAIHKNPLTKLPGNVIIEKEIFNRISGDSPYCIIYIDLDNFKAYNDAYGFENGDLMLKLVADVIRESTLKNEFVGHIGGDDFIVICDYQEAGLLCQLILDKFASRVCSLYRDDDLSNGFIISVNRHGVIESFPIASLSIAGISNKINSYKSLDKFSKEIALLKKKCKKQVGNYFEIL
jgi:EAL domain-containing protein (putative c-di-GMP-specific phosphodiesterase class I)/GGDEF domain-containing protein